MVYRKLAMALIAVCLFTAAADAKPRAPIVDATLGPVARKAMPLILIFRALNPRDYSAKGPLTGGPIGDAIGFFSDADYQKVSKRAAETVRTAFPALDVERQLRAAFRCGEADSLCTEMVVLPQDSSESLDAALLPLLHSHQWTEARLVSFWWHLDEPRLSAHVSLDVMELAPEDKLTFKPFGTLVGYYWTAPPAKGAKNADGAALPHADEWEPGAAAPREASLLAGVANLERLAQAALSWKGAEVADHIRSLPMFNRVDEPGRLECTGLRQCTELVEGLADGNRVWVWALQRTGVYEFQSRPRIAP
jgi:hypothetical protein